MAKYSLPETDVSKKLNVQMIAKNQESEPMFYDTPAMKNPGWKQINFPDRHMFTRHCPWISLFTICTDKSFHQSAKKECECEKCGVKEIGLYTICWSAKLKL
jgi:hypothetical protein